MNHSYAHVTLPGIKRIEPNEMNEADVTLWNMELTKAAERLQIAQKYDDQGEIAWCEERIRWAKHKLRMMGA